MGLCESILSLWSFVFIGCFAVVSLCWVLNFAFSRYLGDVSARGPLSIIFFLFVLLIQHHIFIPISNQCNHNKTDKNSPPTSPTSSNPKKKGFPSPNGFPSSPTSSPSSNPPTPPGKNAKSPSGPSPPSSASSSPPSPNRPFASTGSPPEE